MMREDEEHKKYILRASHLHDKTYNVRIGKHVINMLMLRKKQYTPQ